MPVFSKVIWSGIMTFFFFVLFLPMEIYAGYVITDKDGKVISEEPGNNLILGPTNQTIILKDRGNHKIFKIFWDAGAQTIVVKGDNVHLKIFSNGRLERWTSIEKGEKEYPIVIKPVIPILPPVQPQK